MNQTRTRWWTRRLLRPAVACGAWAVGPLAAGQEPAARLLPAVAVDPPTPAVARGAPPAPGFQFQAPASVPAPGGAANRQPQAPQQASVWGGVKSLFESKPPAEANPEAKPWWPTSDPPPSSQPTSLTGPAQPKPPPKPPTLPPPQSYAGPPACRWYGYGTPTPGANPFAPQGRYPQPTGDWLAQTGATPGAFPVPVGGGPVAPRESLPVLVQSVPQEKVIPQDVERPAPPRNVPEYPNAAVERATLAETPRPSALRPPEMPSGSGAPAVTGAGGVPGPEASWQAVTGGARQPIAASPAAEPLPVPVAPPTDRPADRPEWTPAKQRSAPAPLPTVTVTRGQVETAGVSAEADVEVLIRTACFGRANRVGITRPGPQRLHVTLVVPTEADARDAAAVVSRLPELKAYTVTFEAVVGR